MFGDIPPAYRDQTADSEDEGWRYTQGDKTARRPPELLTRDHVARCIVREIKEGRGSPHGGVFLDIAWIGQRLSKHREHIRRKLPSMYHQFMQLADIDITAAPMEVGPTTHYMMGGVRVHPETQMSTVAGLFAAGECAAGLHGANRLGGNSLSDLLVFGKRAGRHAAEYAGGRAHGTIDESAVADIAHSALEPFERTGEAGAFDIQHRLQYMMQDLVGIVRTQKEMDSAIVAIEVLKQDAAKVAVPGNREYNPGWHTALDLRHLLTVSEAIARAAALRRESRGAHFREDFPEKDADWGATNIVVSRGTDGSMQLRREPIPQMPPELKQIIEEMK
jgi:succinate dehydrogenase / fumarate reductase flavoprotein subunit